jgi:hypothetical protein
LKFFPERANVLNKSPVASIPLHLLRGVGVVQEHHRKISEQRVQYAEAAINES